MTPEEIAERQFISIASALDVTQATIRAGMVASSLPDLLCGVRDMTRHWKIDGGVDRHVEIAWQLRSSGNIRQFRLGATIAANLMCDPEIKPFLIASDKPPPWATHTEQWRKFLTFQFKVAEDFLDIHSDRYVAGHPRPYAHAGNFNENVALNRRKPTDAHSGANLGIGATTSE
ncbi:hypothetical protein C8N36_104153 [Pelagimonas varians]|uniref:Uncharacterized protein n=2 Tax=Pelagimonas varians TaxID=696760 RepID=A0A238K732_9RHOB|nr:hypothetical protein C8N36_104153 [Pelagimonas varians]SMX38688.1 hypothetical protein PEV8663_01491 [Pelagimonas varians]